MALSHARQTTCLWPTNLSYVYDDQIADVMGIRHNLRSFGTFHSHQCELSRMYFLAEADNILLDFPH